MSASLAEITLQGAMPMKVKVDLARNRLYLEISGGLSKRELEKLYTEVRFCVADLQPGFNVIADYSESNLIQLTGISIYRRLMNYLIRSGVAEVARVVDGKSLLFKQVQNLSSRICGYKPFYAQSREEAERILDESMKRSGLRFHYSELPPAEYMVNDTIGTGDILNLSISGCAIGSVSIPPALDADMTVKITFGGQNGSRHEFTIKAHVVRTNENGFAVEFQDFDEDQKDRLLYCLLRETEREL
jgi:hypothetical protein